MRPSAFVALIMFSGCATAAGPQAQFPDGITVSSTAQERGIYPADSPTTCCWLAKDVEFHAFIPSTAADMVLDVYVNPAFGERQPESVNVEIDGVRVGRYDVKMSTAAITIPIPHKSRGKLSTVSMRFSKAYVPKALGINDDVRSLTVILERVRYS